MTTKNDSTSTEIDDPHWIEWLTGLASACVVLAMLLWVGKEAWRHTGEPPELEITVLSTKATAGGGYRVTFDIANTATSTAAAVTVRGEIFENGALLEDSGVTFDYVPAESKTTGAVLFRADPAGRNLRVTVAGYTEP